MLYNRLKSTEKLTLFYLLPATSWKKFVEKAYADCYKALRRRRRPLRAAAICSLMCMTVFSNINKYKEQQRWEFN